MAVTVADKITYRRLVAAGDDRIFYGGTGVAAGSMTELDTSSGAIDCTDQLTMFEAYQKVFVVNGANLKVADFLNTKIIDANGFTNKPARGDIVYQAPSTQILVDYIDSANNVLYGYVISGTAVITTVITAETGGAGDVILPSPDSVTAKPHWYDWTPYDNDTTTYGSLPNKAYLGCLYRGRPVLSGDPEHPHQWYMSRQANPWDFAYVANDAQTPVKGGNSDAGEIGDIVRALIPYKDDYLIFGCASSMWFLAGDPAFGGSINELDLTVGIFGSHSWCFDGEGYLYFWGTNGLYKTTIPGIPRCISEIQLPKLIEDEAADPSTHRITMAYDRRRGGILICITKISDGTNSNWWYDLRSEGFFPESYNAVSGVYSLFNYDANSDTYRDLLVGCKDGYIRKFNESLKSDNASADAAEAGTIPIESYVTFGPLPLFQDDPDKTGKLTAPNLITAGGATSGTQADSNNVAYKMFTANSAGSVLEKLVANTNPQIGGTFIAPGRQTRNRRLQKIKGAYLGVRLENMAAGETWGFEKLIGTVNLPVLSGSS